MRGTPDGLTPDSLRYIFGLKLRKLRRDKALGLKELAKASGVSVSYLSEIEKGRKYPKPDKILALARALGVAFDEMVSLEVDDELAPVRDLFRSPFLREFPFHLYGIELDALMALLVDAPSKVRALLRTAFEIGRLYDVRVEHVLFAALRSYQHLHQNYFEEIEDAAADFAAAHGWSAPGRPTAEEAQAVLEDEHGYRVDFEQLARRPELAELRTVLVEGELVDGEPPILCVNPRLMETQKAFQMTRELGYLRLGLDERSTTSSPLQVNSFDQVIHDFKAAYFAGAVLIEKKSLLAEIEALFTREIWSAEAFLEIFHRHQATPETFFYRLSQLLPHFLGLREVYFLRLGHERMPSDAEPDRDTFQLTKLLNMSQVPIAYGIDPHEHLCRRWAGARLLASLAKHRSAAPEGEILASAQRSSFLGADREFFVFSMARPLALGDGRSSSVSLGFLLDKTFKRRVRFWNDPLIPQCEVDVTCERCPLRTCDDRAAPPRLHQSAAERRARRAALDELTRDVRGEE